MSPGVLLETFLGGIVEIVLFMVLIKQNGEGDRLIPVIRAAILGSILANLLLCLGFCFFVGGIRKGRQEQEFHEAVSEVGSGLLLVAGFGLMIPSAFFASLRGSVEETDLKSDVLHISRITSVVLLVAFFMYEKSSSNCQYDCGSLCIDLYISKSALTMGFLTQSLKPTKRGTTTSIRTWQRTNSLSPSVSSLLRSLLLLSPYTQCFSVSKEFHALT